MFKFQISLTPTQTFGINSGGAHDVQVVQKASVSPLKASNDKESHESYDFDVP